MAEKSEKATPKKLRDARKKRQVAKSQDFPSAFTFATAILILVELAGFMYDKLGTYFVALFTTATRTDAIQVLPSLDDSQSSESQSTGKKELGSLCDQPVYACYRYLKII